MAIIYYLRVSLRYVIGLLDGLIYSVDAMLYELMMDIASAKVFSNETIQDVSMRVYQLLGLVMLFRLIFAFLTYVINPEDMTDKNKGYTKIIKKIFTSLALVIITPWLFTQSRNLQIYIINDHLIEYFIFGTSGSSQAKPGYELMYTVGKIFNTPYMCDDKDCKPHDEEKKSCRGTKWDEDLKKDSTWTTNGTRHVLSLNVAHTSLCAYGASDENYANSLYEAVHPNAAGEYNLHELMHLVYAGNRPNIFWGEGDFYVEAPLIFIGSTLVGVFIGYVLLVMCMDIALRSVKLAFYEMIAPVPILSNLGFKDGKDSMLNKWFHEVLKTYADLFTRVAGLQIAIFAVDELINNSAFEKNGNILVSLFLIIGALMFAKKLPDILKGMGINFEGGGSFNLKKKLSEGIPTGAKRLGAAGLGLLGGAGANLYQAGSNAYKRKKELKDEMAKQGMEYNRKNREAFLRNINNKQYGSRADRRRYAAEMAYSSAREQALKEGKSPDEAMRIGTAAFNKTAKEYKRTHASEYGGNVIAGAFGAAARAATTKDGKLFAGAAEGVKGAVDARDLNDKRQEAGYDWITRQKDTIRSFAGVDTAAKGRANDLRDEISKLQSDAYAYQQQASASMQEFMNLRHIDASGNVLNFTSKDLQDYIKNPTDFASRGMTMGMTDSELNRLDEAANAYNQATQNYSSTQTKITKTNKKIGLYEKEKK